jgi:hypothetical protein
VLTSNGSAWVSSTPSGGGFTGARGQVFTSSGTFTIPTGISSLKVTVVGGGGGTVIRTNTNFTFSGGGGAGGGAIVYLTSLTSGNTISVTVGSAGTNTTITGSDYDTAGGTGGTSSISSGTQSITTVSSTGGTGGFNADWTGGPQLVAMGDGGTATNGTINIQGEGGDYGIFGFFATNYGTSYWSSGGKGGSSIIGLGGRSAYNHLFAGPKFSATASGFGAGAGGCAMALSGNFRDAGSAGAGIVIFEW